MIIWLQRLGAGLLGGVSRSSYRARLTTGQVKPGSTHHRPSSPTALGVVFNPIRELQIAFAVNSVLARSRLCFIMRRDALK